MLLLPLYDDTPTRRLPIATYGLIGACAAVFLWLFGKGVEGALGPLRYLVFYFICGAAAALTQAFISPTAMVPMIGASGAIAGVIGAYLVLFPRGNVLVFLWIL